MPRPTSRPCMRHGPSQCCCRRSFGRGPMSKTAISDVRLKAPPLQVARWFNSERPIALEDLRGKVVVVHAFQMLCPGCVAYAIPQARRLHELASKMDDLVVLGLHTVFE